MGFCWGVRVVSALWCAVGSVASRGREGSRSLRVVCGTWGGCSHFLASADQRGYEYRHSSRCGGSVTAPQLWRLFTLDCHAGYGPGTERQHQALLILRTHYTTTVVIAFTRCALGTAPTICCAT